MAIIIEKSSIGTHRDYYAYQTKIGTFKLSTIQYSELMDDISTTNSLDIRIRARIEAIFN